MLAHFFEGGREDAEGVVGAGAEDHDADFGGAWGEGCVGVVV